MEIEEAHFTFMINPKNFPSKLWCLVNDPQFCSICWDESGEGILIYQQPFEVEVLLCHNKPGNNYFKTTDFTSFIRQLNLYGFRKVRHDLDIPTQQLSRFFVMTQPHHFHNPNFKQDKPELLVNLRRLTPVNKAKLAAGIPFGTRRSSECFHHVMLNLPQENSALKRKGSDLVGHHGTPYPHPCNDSEQTKEDDRSPKSSQAFVLGHVYQSCTPGSKQSAASYSPCGYYPVRAEKHFKDYLVGYHHSTDQAAGWRAGGDSRKNDIRVNLDTVFKVADEMQAAADVRAAAQAARHLRRELEQGP